MGKKTFGETFGKNKLSQDNTEKPVKDEMYTILLPETTTQIAEDMTMTIKDILETTTAISMDDKMMEEMDDLEPEVIEKKKQEIRKEMMKKLIGKLRNTKRRNRFNKNIANTDDKLESESSNIVPIYTTPLAELTTQSSTVTNDETEAVTDAIMTVRDLMGLIDEETAESKMTTATEMMDSTENLSNSNEPTSGKNFYCPITSWHSNSDQPITVKILH